MKSTAEAFRAEIEAFLEKSKMSPSQFGHDAVNDRSFVRDLRAGRAPNLRIVDRVHAFMKANESIGGDNQ